MTKITIIITDKAKEISDRVDMRMEKVVLKVAGEIEVTTGEYLIWCSEGKIDKSKIIEMLGNYVKSIVYVSWK